MGGFISLLSGNKDVNRDRQDAKRSFHCERPARATGLGKLSVQPPPAAQAPRGRKGPALRYSTCVAVRAAAPALPAAAPTRPCTHRRHSCIGGAHSAGAPGRSPPPGPAPPIDRWRLPCEAQRVLTRVSPRPPP